MSDTSNARAGDEPEKYITIARAAETLGLRYWQVQRAVKAQLIPSYAPFGKRRLLRISEVVAAIDASKAGGEA